METQQQAAQGPAPSAAMSYVAVHSASLSLLASLVEKVQVVAPCIMRPSAIVYSLLGGMGPSPHLPPWVINPCKRRCRGGSIIVELSYLAMHLATQIQ